MSMGVPFEHHTRGYFLVAAIQVALFFTGDVSYGRIVWQRSQPHNCLLELFSLQDALAGTQPKACFAYLV